MPGPQTYPEMNHMLLLRNFLLVCVFSAAAAAAEEPPNTLPLLVHNPAGLEGTFPVTGGVPLPEGAAPVGAALTLRDASGTVAPLQASVLSRWPDDSARWLLLDFQAAPGQGGPAAYTLQWGPNGEARNAEAPGKAPRVSAAKDALVTLGGRIDVFLALTRGDGATCIARIEDKLKPEVEGPLRYTYALRGAFHTPENARVFQFRLRVSAYAGSSLIKVEPMILVDADEGVMQLIRDVRLVMRPHEEAQSGALGGKPGWSGDLAEATRLYQIDDRFYEILHTDVAETMAATGEKAPGWAAITDGSKGFAVALRDFWQQWPKDLVVAKEGIEIGLLPRFEAGDFSHMEPWYKYQYLFEGDTYRIRTGQARRWEVWVDLEGNGAQLAAAANAPLVVAAAPDAAVRTGVWGEIAPAGAPGMAAYDTWAENLFDAYEHEITVQRDYGAMNWGDWFGERQVNWGNLEYDTTQQILLQFARTGDPKYRYAAETAAHHSAEVDTVHYVNDALIALFGAHADFPARPGLVHQHTVGHVSGFYPTHVIRQLFVDHGIGNSPTPYLCLDPYNLGHVWTQGMTHAYFFTGDPFLRETVARIAQNLAQLVEDGEHAFMGHPLCGRTTGWSLLALSGAYEITREKRYLKAMRTLVDGALKAQDPVCGGWLYEMPDDHCPCKTRKHVGMAGFVTAILINGMSEYYRLTGDDRLPPAIGRAITYFDNATWQETWSDWRATPCPATGKSLQPGVVMMAHVNGARIAKNAEARRILAKAWAERFAWISAGTLDVTGQGKIFSAKLLGSPETVGLLAAEGLLDKAEPPE